MSQLYSIGKPRRVDQTIVIKAGVQSATAAITPPAKGKRWSICFLESAVDANTFIANFKLNNQLLGFGVQGSATAGAVGSFNIRERFGDGGVWVSNKDTMSIETGSVAVKDTTVLFSISVVEYDV